MMPELQAEVDKLKEVTQKLLDVLNDPHPGLVTWWWAINDLTREIGNFKRLIK